MNGFTLAQTCMSPLFLPVPERDSGPCFHIGESTARCRVQEVKGTPTLLLVPVVEATGTGTTALTVVATSIFEAGIAFDPIYGRTAAKQMGLIAQGYHL